MSAANSHGRTAQLPALSETGRLRRCWRRVQHPQLAARGCLARAREDHTSACTYARKPAARIRHALVRAYRLTTCIRTYIYTYMHTYTQRYTPTSTHRRLLASVHAHVYLHVQHTYTHAYIHAYMHPCIHTCLHAPMHKYLHTCIDAEMHGRIDA